MADWTDDIIELPDEALPQRPEDLPGDLRQVAEVAARVTGCPKSGALIAWRIGLEFRGTAVFCHNLDAVFRRYRDRAMVAEFDRRTMAGETAGAVVRSLALRPWPGLGRIAARQIWNVIGRPAEDDRQMDMFG